MSDDDGISQASHFNSNRSLTVSQKAYRVENAKVVLAVSSIFLHSEAVSVRWFTAE